MIAPTLLNTTQKEITLGGNSRPKVSAETVYNLCSIQKPYIYINLKEIVSESTEWSPWMGRLSAKRKGTGEVLVRRYLYTTGKGMMMEEARKKS